MIHSQSAPILHCLLLLKDLVEGLSHPKHAIRDLLPEIFKETLGVRTRPSEIPSFCRTVGILAMPCRKNVWNYTHNG